MCGRYYVDDETAREIEKLVRQIDERKRQESIQAVSRIAVGDSIWNHTNSITKSL